MTSTEIKHLISLGFKRWQKGDYDRLYIDIDKLGFEWESYKSSGMTSWATLDGEKISNSRMNEYRNCKVYVDVNTGEIHANDTYTRASNSFLVGLCQKFIDENPMTEELVNQLDSRTMVGTEEQIEQAEGIIRNLYSKADEQESIYREHAAKCFERRPDGRSGHMNLARANAVDKFREYIKDMEAKHIDAEWWINSYKNASIYTVENWVFAHV